MKYKLIGTNDYRNPLKTLLQNRNVDDVNGYINMSEEVVIPYQNLANLDKAVETYKNHVEQNHNICVVVDPDVDGYTSAAMIYKYTKNLNPDCKLTYLIHDGKGHGLTSEIDIPNDTNLLIIPDAGTNDTEQCKAISQRGIDIIILDHHEAEVDNPYAVIVNNQCSPDYNNKQLSGAGIVYKFLQAVDEEMWNEDADNYIDLVALAQIGDNMDMRSCETRYLTNKGLEMIVNQCFEALVNAQSFYFPEGITVIGIQFYVTPLINALIRVGTQEEKDILFRAFIEDESETFAYKKRGQKEFTQETIYERAARICKNAKSKQTRILDKQLPEIINHIEENKQNNHEVIITNVTDYIEQTLTGVVAIKIAERYHKPCLLVRKSNDGTFKGSCRVSDTSPIDNFKNVLNGLGVAQAQGHPSACGVSLVGKEIPNAINILDEYIKINKLQDIGVKKIDFEIDYEDLESAYYNIVNLKPYYGYCIDECNVVVKNIPIGDIEIKGEAQNTWSVKVCDEAIELIKFRCPEHETMLQLKGNCTINIIGKMAYSYFKGIKTAQIIIDDYEVIVNGQRI